MRRLRVGSMISGASECGAGLGRSLRSGFSEDWGVEGGSVVGGGAGSGDEAGMARPGAARTVAATTAQSLISSGLSGRFTRASRPLAGLPR